MLFNKEQIDSKDMLKISLSGISGMLFFIFSLNLETTGFLGNFIYILFNKVFGTTRFLLPIYNYIYIINKIHKINFRKIIFVFTFLILSLGSSFFYLDFFSGGILGESYFNILNFFIGELGFKMLVIVTYFYIIRILLKNLNFQAIVIPKIYRYFIFVGIKNILEKIKNKNLF